LSRRHGVTVVRDRAQSVDTRAKTVTLANGPVIGYDKLIVETVGAGQNDVAIRTFVDRTAVVVVPGMGDSVQMDKAGILEIADVFVANKADHAGEAKLVRELLDVAGGRPILETIATQGKGIVELLEALFPA
jgi:LAO/AO transport system kinase